MGQTGGRWSGPNRLNAARDQSKVDRFARVTDRRGRARSTRVGPSDERPAHSHLAHTGAVALEWAEVRRSGLLSGFSLRGRPDGCQLDVTRRVTSGRARAMMR
jgi:hypothetical protein